jgi:hypothetical protein
MQLLRCQQKEADRQVDCQQAEAAGLAEEVKVEHANVCTKRHEVQQPSTPGISSRLELKPKKPLLKSQSGTSQRSSTWCPRVRARCVG